MGNWDGTGVPPLHKNSSMFLLVQVYVGWCWILGPLLPLFLVERTFSLQKLYIDDFCWCERVIRAILFPHAQLFLSMSLGSLWGDMFSLLKKNTTRFHFKTSLHFKEGLRQRKYLRCFLSNMLGCKPLTYHFTILDSFLNILDHFVAAQKRKMQSFQHHQECVIMSVFIWRCLTP